MLQKARGASFISDLLVPLCEAPANLDLAGFSVASQQAFNGFTGFALAELYSVRLPSPPQLLRVSLAVLAGSTDTRDLWNFSQHVGEAIEVTLTSERDLWLGPDDQDARPHFLSLALRQDRCSLTIYSPIEAIWTLPGFIASGQITHVEIDFYEPKRRVADILDHGFSKIEDMRALDAQTGKQPLQASKSE